MISEMMRFRLLLVERERERANEQIGKNANHTEHLSELDKIDLEQILIFRLPGLPSWYEESVSATRRQLGRGHLQQT